LTPCREAGFKNLREKFEFNLKKTKSKKTKSKTKKENRLPGKDARAKKLQGGRII